MRRKIQLVIAVVLAVNATTVNATTIGQPNSPPIADAGADQIKMDIDLNGEETFTLDASASSDTDGSIISYEWTDKDGNILGIQSTLERIVSLGSEQLKLTVTDDSSSVAIDYIELFTGEPTNYGNNRLPIRGGTQDIFVNGINLAWDDFSRDIVDFNSPYFTSVFEKLSNYGANGLRWWLHTNGRYSPQFGDDGLVKKISPDDIRNMRIALDMAHEKGIVISMCLFSFDLLQNQGQDLGQMRKLIEDETVLQSYIDNALIPVMNQIGDHPAVMTWEIFNEPEGMTNEFGWSTERTDMAYVQAFVNKVAGAIHRNTENALVSTGSWSAEASTDVEDYFDYYRDDRLIAAGGDPDGTLDFYQIHYYATFYGNAYSPFHRPASHWGIDKPIVIGEFSVNGIEGQADPYLTITECYQIAMEYGYAGLMAWDYTGYEGGDIETAKPGMEYLATNYPSDIFINADPGFNRAPLVNGTIPNMRAYSGNGLDFQDYFDLSTIFSDPEAESLTYSLYDISNSDFTQVSFEGSMMSINPYDGVEGTAIALISATDPEGASEWASFSINLRKDLGNLAMFKSINASSEENGSEGIKLAELANDGDLETRWSSVYEDNEWIEVDLGAIQDFNQVKLYWEAAFAESYKLEVSDDQENWTQFYSDTNADGNTDELDFEVQNGRYIRLLCEQRATAWGNSLWEFEVYYNTVLSAEKQVSATEVLVYPNPVSSEITINSNATVNDIYLYDMQGRQMNFTRVGSAPKINISHLEPGLYVLKLKIEKEFHVFRIVKN